MAKKRPSLSKKQKTLLFKYGPWALVILVSLLVGFFFHIYLSNHSHPKNLIWAADKTVTIPSGLKDFLGSRNDCKAYRGTGTPTGVGLWGVYQVEKQQFAKIAYGCSWSLISYIMAIKQNNKWLLIPPTEYFASGSSNGANLPKCQQLSKYKISKQIEPFCIDDGGAPQSNPLP